jgi:hypothetical protein
MDESKKQIYRQLGVAKQGQHISHLSIGYIQSDYFLLLPNPLKTASSSESSRIIAFFLGALFAFAFEVVAAAAAADFFGAAVGLSSNDEFDLNVPLAPTSSSSSTNIS